MALYMNGTKIGTTLGALRYNNINITEVRCNGVIVWQTLVPIINQELVYYRAYIDDINKIYFDLLNSSWSYYFSSRDKSQYIQSMNFNSNIYPIANIESYNGITLRLVLYEGGDIFSITQQPTKDNGYKAIINLHNTRGGNKWFSLRLYISSVY